MARFGQAKLFGLGDEAEAGAPSYRARLADRLIRDGALRRLGYLARANYAYNYIHWLRKSSNDPSFIARAGGIERRLRHPISATRESSPRAQAYRARDFHVEHQMLSRPLLARFRHHLESEPSYYDPYIPGFRYQGAPAASRHPFLYMESQRLFENSAFLEIVSNPTLIDFSREVLGPSAALSWAWAWISQPGALPYQNQNWHRDSAEPLNFIRVFVPLQDIAGLEDGPTELIPGTSGLRDFYDVRRFSDGELARVKAEKGSGVILCEAGDVYFINTFALHRGTPPKRPRAMLTLLVSLAPSHRTPSIGRQRVADLAPELRERVRENRSFFRFLVR